MTGRRGPAPIVDTHAHLDDDAFASDLNVVVAESRSAGVTRIINIGYRPRSWDASLRLRDRFHGVYFALGLHPQFAAEFGSDLEQSLVEKVELWRPVAIGETGFDFSRSNPSFSEQQLAFQRQIEIVIEAKLPIIIHQRNASDALIAELDRWPAMAPIVLHSFDGNRRLTDWAIERGCFIGVGGLATRNGSAALRGLLSHFPIDRLLLETDSPYLAPPYSPSRRNTPAQLPAIAASLAPLWDLSEEELCWQTSANACAVFDLDSA